MRRVNAAAVTPGDGAPLVTANTTYDAAATTTTAEARATRRPRGSPGRRAAGPTSLAAADNASANSEAVA